MASQASVRDSVIYLAVAAGIAGTPLLLFHNHPVAFAYLVAEDFHGEYATAAAFGAASLLFLADAWRAPARSRRAISAAIALAALLIAGEEVSWGHRLWYGMLDFAKPDLLQKYNVQGELNLHNLEGVGLTARFYELAVGIMLGWLTISASVFWFMPGLAARLDDAGVPLVPPRLAPLFLVTAGYFLLEPVAKSDEVAELALGVAVLAFGLDRAARAAWLDSLKVRPLPQALAVSLAAVGLLASALAQMTPPQGISLRLHGLATLDYPRRGMYDQVEQIFAYVDRHRAGLEQPYTRLSRAEVLVDAGRLEEARTAMAAAVEQLKGDQTALSGDYLCRLEQLHAAFGKTQAAEAAFGEALTVDRQLLQEVVDPDERAALLWSQARTLQAQGLRGEARTMALKAEQAASSARLRRDLNAWLLQLDGAGEVAAVDAHLVGRIGRVCSLQEWALRAPTPR